MTLPLVSNRREGRLDCVFVAVNSFEFSAGFAANRYDQYKEASSYDS